MHSNPSRFSLARRWLGGLTLGAGVFAATGALGADVFAPGVLKVEFFKDIGSDVAIDTLLNADKYVNNQPDEVRYINSFSSPNGYADNYGARVSGYLTPTESGDYDFFIRADDQAQLFVSTDDKVANAALVAQEISACCEAFKEPGADETTQVPIALVAGKRYYFYAVLKEGGGGDWMEVAWRKTTDTTAAGNLKPLAGSVIGTFAPAGTVAITTGPQAVTTIEGVNATFSVATTYTGVSAPGFQWRRNGADISGANGSSYTTPVLTLGDSGAKYSVKVTVPGAEAISSEVVLTVNADTIPPKVVSSGALKHGADYDVAVLFDEKVNPATVVAANFTLSGGTIKSVRHIPNSSTLKSFEQGAVITASGLTAGNSYTVTVKNVADLKGNKITSADSTFKASAMTWAALGNGDTTEFPAAALGVGDSGFNLNSGGNAFWGTSDDVTFVYEEVTGDFDKVVRVEGQDASSQWARAGLHARETLATGAGEASRYQQVHANPTIKADGGASNYSFETNRRLVKGGDTSSSSGGGTPLYPNAWLRLNRRGDVMHFYRSDDAVTWTKFNPTDFNPADNPAVDGPLAPKMYVGPVFGPENGNLDASVRNDWAAVYREYGDYKPNKPLGKQTYAIGLNFQDGDDPNDNDLAPKEVAGVASVAQSNWNNIAALASSEAPVALSADAAGVAKASTATVEWTCPNTWSSTGRGEENNQFVGSDRRLMTGYLDTGGATTTKVTLSNLPNDLTGSAGGYDVVLYTLGGVPARGGGFRVTDANGTELKPVILGQGPANPSTFTEISKTDTNAPGTYVVFKGLTAKSIIVEASTENGWAFGGTPRAPINAIQLVVPTGTIDKPTEAPTISIAGGATVKVTFTGTLQKAASVNGPFTDVAGATSPFTVTGADAQAYFRSRQ